MGLRAWLIKKLVGDNLRAISQDKLSMVADEYLKQTAQKHSRTLRDAEKINKAKLLDMQESQLRRELREGLGDDEDEDNDEPEGDSFEDSIKQMLIQKFLGGVSLPGNPGGIPITSPSGIPGLEGVSLEDLGAAAKQLSPEQLEQLKNKFTGGNK